MSSNDDQVTLKDETKENAGATVTVIPKIAEHQNAGAAATDSLFDPNKLGILDEVTVAVTIEIGRAQIKIRDLLNLTKDSIIDLDKLAGEPVDVYVNGKLISKGNIITVNGKYCVRLISIPNKSVSKEI
jgi:flagellar motor switch protein FliN